MVADYFVICSGTSERQLNALTRDLTETLKRETGLTPMHSEGNAASGWALLDYGDVVVHVFSPAEREYYRLEEIWGGKPVRLKGAAPNRVKRRAKAPRRRRKR